MSLDGTRVGDIVFGEKLSKPITAGWHRMRVHNTLFWKTVDFTVAVGEHASFEVVNRPGPGTWSVLAYLIGANVLYLGVHKTA